jgi:hypothetical protein
VACVGDLGHVGEVFTMRLEYEDATEVIDRAA